MTDEEREKIRQEIRDQMLLDLKRMLDENEKRERPENRWKYHLVPFCVSMIPISLGVAALLIVISKMG